MSNDKPFLSEVYTAQVTSERLNLVQQMIQFVMRNIENQYDRPITSKDGAAWRNSINGHLMKIAKGVLERASDPKWATDNCGDTHELLANIIIKCRQWEGDTWSREIPFTAPAVQDKMGKLTGMKRMKYPSDVPRTIQGALDMAWYNYRSATAGIIAQCAIETIVGQVTSGANVAASDLVMAELRRRRQIFLTDMLMFGGLVGGECHAAVLKVAVNTRLVSLDEHTNYSLMEYLEPGGIHPGMYAADDEKKFRESIMTAYTAIKTSNIQ